MNGQLHSPAPLHPGESARYPLGRGLLRLLSRSLVPKFGMQAGRQAGRRKSLASRFLLPSTTTRSTSLEPRSALMQKESDISRSGTNTYPRHREPARISETSAGKLLAPLKLLLNTLVLLRIEQKLCVCLCVPVQASVSWDTTERVCSTLIAGKSDEQQTGVKSGGNVPPKREALNERS
jgi:hypothetical protein